MIFSSYLFMFAFLPVVLLGYYALSRLKNGFYQRLFLIFASLFFYGYYNINYVFLILLSIAVNYMIALQIQKSGQKIWLCLGVAFNILLIGYFKYYDFFIDNINSIFHARFLEKNIVLPLGISLFTFQQISFLISVFKAEEKVEKLRDYCLFVLFFPQLIAGPIVLYSEMISQFKENSRRYFCADRFASGLYIFTTGLFKKAVIADTLAVFVDNGFAMTGLGMAVGWAVSVSYTLQIYFDFSGYSDMAVGLGKMFNIDLPFNFLSPYKSESISEFWKRWHITLGRALSTYIYIPLGGNRKGLPRTCVNLFLTFLVSGLWHGASWTFVFWGGCHGLFVVLERIFGQQLERLPRGVRISGTFLIVNCLWVLFRADSFANAFEIYKGMINFAETGVLQLAEVVGVGVLNYPAMVDIAYITGLIFVLLLVIFKCESSVSKLKSFVASYKTAITTVLLFCISLLCLSRESAFIYFNF